MVEISEEFRAGWEAGKDGQYNSEATEEHLGIAWDAYCGTITPTPVAPNAFAHDWNNMVATVSVFCSKYGLLKPDMIFHPQWWHVLCATSEHPISRTLIHMGVRVKFATLEQATVIREM